MGQCGARVLAGGGAEWRIAAAAGRAARTAPPRPGARPGPIAGGGEVGCAWAVPHP